MAQIIQNDRYPKFVADQVLTAKSLNQMFGYLEEQQRLTRSTLIGIGILCGLEVELNDSFTELTITEGVGVTSEGYLVPFPETTYTFYNDEYTAEQEIFYDRFLDGNNEQKFDLYLLHNSGAAEIRKPITQNFLRDKAVMIFVELLKVDNKNCDPDSCDDKGYTVEMTLRPLLIDLDDLDGLKGNEKNPYKYSPSCIEWPEIKMPRYNVPSTLLLSSHAVLRNFLTVLNSSFLREVEKVLSQAYQSFGILIRDEYPNNPFSNLRTRFRFLFDGSLNHKQLLYIQYFYDFFSDLILAYQELRKICNKCLSMCCPDPELFPRHLILGNAIPSADEFRHPWISSPACNCAGCSRDQLVFLLKKIILMYDSLDLSIVDPEKIKGSDIKITPSHYGNVNFSEKAIPYYYDVDTLPDELFKNWNFQKSNLQKANTNLSYHASLYNNHDYVVNPLKYDIEPYNFFRIEGHIGKPWKSALAEINKIKNSNRLPIDVVAMNGDIIELILSILRRTSSLADLISGREGIVQELLCYFADLESQYDALAAELRCELTRVMSYFYSQKVLGYDGEPEATQNVPESELIRLAFPNYKTYAHTYGEEFDKYYQQSGTLSYVTFNYLVTTNFFNVTSPSARQNILNPIYLMYYLEKIHEALSGGLIKLDIKALSQRLQDATSLAGLMIAATEKMNDSKIPSFWVESFDAIFRICKAEAFKVIFQNFLLNYALFVANQTFAMYAFRNAGIQHKAGVTSGGTFILVYNDKRDRGQINTVWNEMVVRVKKREVSNEEILSEGPKVKEKIPDESIAAEAFNSGRSIIREADIDQNPVLNLKATSSIKEQNYLDMLTLVTKNPGDDKLPELRRLLEQFEDGIVIADFFVPYVCKSACMPINFIVTGDHEPGPGETEVILSIKPKEFCQDDKKEYIITATPSGGKLTIDGELNKDGIFIPASVDVGNNAAKEVVITYEVNDDVKNIRVKVYHKPVIDFSVDKKNNKLRQATFKNDTQFADSYHWDFGNGQSSDKADPGAIKFKDEVAKVILTAYNGPCKVESRPLIIDFGEEPNEQFTCASINDLDDQFKAVDEKANDAFKKSISQYEMLQELFLEKFPEIEKLPPKAQCESVMAAIDTATFNRIIVSLNALISNDAKNRSSGLTLFCIVLQLIMFIACCQKEDVDKAAYKTAALFKLVLGILNSWIDKIDFNRTQKTILKKMLNAVADEINLNEKHSPHKEFYISQLNNILETLQKLTN